MLLIDSREQVKGRVAQQLKQWKIDTHIMKLECADFYLPRIATGIERKVISDMLSDFQRLDNQLMRCKDMYQNVILLLEGNYNFDMRSGTMMRRDGDNLRPTGISHEQFQKKLLSIELLHGIHLFRTNNLTDTCLFLRNLHGWADKPVHRALGFDGSNAMRVQSIYAALPGIGPELSRRVLEKFPTAPIPSDFADKLYDVKGFDKARVEQVRSFLRGDYMAKQVPLDLKMEDDT